ncbi:MAG: rubredoxin [bacterium]
MKFRCRICGYIYDEEKEGQKWGELPGNWVCPECGAPKEQFEELNESRFMSSILGIKDETPDVKTFRIEKPKDFSFISGQFCLVSFVNNAGYPGGAKPFTFSNSPTDGYLELTIKEMGIFTKALFSLAAGDKLWIDGPRGNAHTFDESVKKNVVFVAGGSGITPFMSALRYAVVKKLANRFTLFFGNQSVKDIIYKEEMDRMVENNGNIKIIHCISRDDPQWHGEHGYIDKGKILKYIHGPEDKLWYLCGPPPMTRSIRSILAEIGIEEGNIRFDKWEIPGKS